MEGYMEYVNKTNARQTCIYCGQPCGKARDYIPPRDLVDSVDETEASDLYPELPCVVSACQQCKSHMFNHRYKLLTLQSRVDFMKVKFMPKKPKKTVDEIRDIVAAAKSFNVQQAAARQPGRFRDISEDEIMDREKMTNEWLINSGVNMGNERSASPVETESDPVTSPDDF